MPIPTRKSGEDRDEFVSRCVGEMKVLEESFTNKQIAAICYARLHKSFDSKD
jgi:hypothetical protein